MAFLFLEQLNQAVNAAIATSVGAGRLVLAAAQLQECRNQNNPHRNSWIPGMAAQNLQWAADPCQTQQEEVDQLIAQGAAEGNQVATQQLGAAPAPQLAESVDPVPNTDPAVPLSEFVVPEPGAQNPWSPVLPEEVMDMIIDLYEGEEPPEQMLLDNILDQMRYYLLWCPWGGPNLKNLKWHFKYKPKNSNWVGNWVPV